MKEITVTLPDRLHDWIERSAKERGQELSDYASTLLRRGYELMASNRTIPSARGQRPGAERDGRLGWWREAKFGMFIHWGLYALPAGVWKGRDIPGIGEWIMHRAEIPVKEYEQLAARFNPVRFNAAEWVSLAKRAGQKYLIITSKHHDGFCLFKTQHSRYNVVDATPFRRDVLKELAGECARQGIKLGFYYSQTQDWYHPDGVGNDWDFDPAEKHFDAYLESYVKPQVRELLTSYGPVAVIWFDTPLGIEREQSQSLLDLVHELQPECLVSGRLGNGLGDYASAGDNQIPGELVNTDWETPATINDTWGFKSKDTNWKSPEDLVRKLVDIVSKGGNYLLNVGPTAEGVIPQASVERLTAMGDWLSQNGESIYGTRPGPIQGEAWCRTTAKEDRVFLHVFNWPRGGKIALRTVTVSSARMLATNEKLEVEAGGGAVTILAPGTAPDAIDTVIELRR